MNVGRARVNGVLQHLIDVPHDRRSERHFAQMLDIVASGLGPRWLLRDGPGTPVTRRTLDSRLDVLRSRNARHDRPFERKFDGIDRMRIRGILHSEENSVVYFSERKYFVLA